MQLAESHNHQASPYAEDFRLFLQQELVSRCAKNSAYSLRAFAKVLGIHHASLSRLLARKRPLTARVTKQLCLALQLSPIQTETFLQSIPRKSRTPNLEALSHQNLTLDTFISISEWYHDAILELTHLRSFRPEPKWIAKVLGITQNEVTNAVERLQRLDLLEIKESKWIDLSRNNTTNITNDFTSAALRKLQKKILDLSGEALENLPRTERDHTSMMAAVDSADLPEVKERIKQFLFELAAFLQRKQAKPDSVCQLAISFFPLTQIPSENS